MPIRHRKVVDILDDPSYPVGSAEWNDDHIGLENVDNTSDANKPVSTAQQAAINAGVASVTKTSLGLGNVDNTSDATKNAAVATLSNKTLTTPVINGPTGIVKADVGLGNVDNTSDANKPLSTADTNALALKAPLASPAFTGSVGINQTAPAAPLHVGDQTILNSSGRIRSSTHDNAGGSRSWDFGADFATFGNYSFNIKDVSATTRLTIDLNGNFGIGTSTPTNGKLVINGSAVTVNQGVQLLSDSLDFRMVGESATTGAGWLGTFSPHNLHLYTNSTLRAIFGGSTGLLRLTAYGAGTLITDATGNITAAKGPVYASQFGIVGDGVTDNTAAYVTAMNAFPATGGTLILPPGICLGTIVVNKANVILQGQGWSSGAGGTGTYGTEIRSTGAADNVILISAGGVQVRDLGVTSSVAAASRTGAGIKVTGGTNVLISRVFSNGHKYGIWNQAAGNEFEHVFTVGNQTYGMFFDGSLGTGALNETAIYYCQANSNLGTAGIGIVGGGFAHTGIFMVRPTAATNTGAGLLISGAINDVHIVVPELSSNTVRQLDAVNGSGGNLTVIGGLIEVVTGGGEAINCGSAQQFVTLTGNIITSTGGAIVIQGAQSTIVGNIIAGQGATNVVAYGGAASKLTIAANNISGNNTGGQVGISIAAGATGCMIGANTFTSVPTQIADGTAAATYAAITTTKPTYP